MSEFNKIMVGSNEYYFVDSSTRQHVNASLPEFYSKIDLSNGKFPCDVIKALTNDEVEFNGVVYKSEVHPEYINAIVDDAGHLLWGIKKNGDVEWAKGIPTPVKTYIQENFIETESNINNILEQQNSSIQSVIENLNSISDTTNVIEDPVYLHMVLDSSDRIICGIKDNGKVYISNLEADNFNFDNNDKLESLIYNVSTNTQEIAAIKNNIPVNINTSSIFSRVDKTEWNNKLLTASYKLNLSIGGSNDASISPFLLFMCSDVHKNYGNLNRFYEFKDEFKSYFDDTIIVGDILNVYNETMPDSFSADANKKVMFAIGNHENADYTNGGVGMMSTKNCYDKYFFNINQWGVTQPDNANTVGKMYYYKDYPTKQIRLIVLDNINVGRLYQIDCTEYWRDEKTWLINILEDAITQDLNVIICCHYPCFKEPNTFVEGTFTSLLRNGITPYLNMWVSKELLPIVQTFKNNGGKFICWLCGHIHTDFMLYPDGYPDQLVITTNSAGTNRHSDNPRTANTVLEDSYTVFVADPDDGHIILMRVGCPYDTAMRSKTIISYDYINKKIIYNN